MPATVKAYAIVDTLGDLWYTHQSDYWTATDGTTKPDYSAWPRWKRWRCHRNWSSI